MLYLFHSYVKFRSLRTSDLHALERRLIGDTLLRFLGEISYKQLILTFSEFKHAVNRLPNSEYPTGPLYQIHQF